MTDIKIEISLKSILLVIVVLLLLLTAWLLREVILMLFIAFILNSAFRPFVDTLEKRKVPRIISILLVYLLLFVIIGFVVANILSEAVVQLENLLDNLPGIIKSVTEQASVSLPWIKNLLDTEALNNSVQNFIQNFQNSILKDGITGVFSILGKAFGFIFSLIFVLVITAYMLLREHSVYHSLANLAPKSKRSRYEKLFEQIDAQLGKWVRGQLLLMLMISFATWLVLVIPSLFIDGYRLHEFALPLALLAGLLEAIPNIGPLITAIIAVIIAAGFNPAIVVVYVIISFLFIQQLENAVFVPMIMRKSVGLDSIVIIIGVVSAASLFGILGAILIVPLLAIAQIVVQFGINESKLKSS